MNRRRFWLVIAFFVGSFALIVVMQRVYHARFGAAFGRVVDAADGSGVPGARIELYSEFAGEDDTLRLLFHTETAEDGAFRFKTTVGGDFRMTVEHPGYRTRTKQVQIESAAQNDLGRIEMQSR